MSGQDARQTIHVYIQANRHRTLYTGLTSNLARRMAEHSTGLRPGFSSRYGIDRLVHVETTSNVRAAIEREKQIKRWVRAKKLALIETANPEWKDLSREWW